VRKGDALIGLDVPGKLFARYEWAQEGKRYREALIPASELNEHGTHSHERTVLARRAESFASSIPASSIGFSGQRRL
jgi:hypothetical protein